MTYLKVRWRHSEPSEPVWLYSELDGSRRETRKVEVFADGRRGFADGTVAVGSTSLGVTPIPTVEEIARDPQFEATTISNEEFEREWSSRRRQQR